MVKNLNPLEYSTVDFDPFAGPEILAVAPATEPQKEIWASCLLGGEQANRAFNESFSVHFSGLLNRDALTQSIKVLISRHESLRAAFSADGQQICIFAGLENPLSYYDLSYLDTRGQEAYIQDLAQQEVVGVLDLLIGPLFKATLLKLSDTEHYLTITAHHIICDGWSFNIILQELSKLYSASVQNVPGELTPPVAYSKYANRQQVFSESDEYRQTENFWINQYKENIPVLNLSYRFSATRTQNL